MTLEYNKIPESEIQKTLFLNWLNEIRKQPKKRDYKVPSKITILPCGCHRQITHEGDPNNIWKIKIKGESYIHTQCNNSIN